MSASPTPADGDERIFSARVEPRGLDFKASSALTLLQAAEQASRDGIGGMQDLTLASACRNGTCRTCICRLTTGEVRYRIEWPGLSLDEKKDGYILPCVAYPASDVVLALPP